MRPLRALVLGTLVATPLVAQPAPTPPVTVDSTGVLRWTATGREVALFGVNYAAPFAYDLRAIRALGADPKRAIDQDVAHLARLGMDAYRIHVWDREVSDREGNLLANEQLDLLDYLIARLEARGIKVLLTPIAWWGPGYPEPDPPSPGFSNGYTKPQMAVDTVARKAQARYLAQFVSHLNPYTGRRYRDDPDIIAFEVFNEPWHDLSPPEETTRYVDTLVAAMRATGLRKPVFYNISEHFTPAHGRAVCAARIDGVSAQWYPTGLVRGATLPGNPLPNVDRYPLPWADLAGCRDKARMVYEFDAADVALPVMYPAMARAFRGAGFQWATQFAYDPLAIAHTNTEYQTHFLNLVHTPAKAISLLIAGEAFRRLPRGVDAGTYPASERFGPFRTSYAEGRSELLDDTLFAHTGRTDSEPPASARLRHIAAVGGSPLVEYPGTGAYFLDRLAPGVWRLELYPDAVPVEDPFTRGNLRRAVTRIVWRTHRMRLAIPDLSSEFTVTPLNSGNRHRPAVTDGGFDIRPGAYLLTRRGASPRGWTPERRAFGRALGEFHAPPPGDGPTVVRHEVPESVVEGQPFTMRVEVASTAAPDSVVAFVRYPGWQGHRRAATLASEGPYAFAAPVWPDSGRTGPMEYVVTLYDGRGATTYPAGVSGAPSAWDFPAASHWETRVEPRGRPLSLFDADRDRARVVGAGFVPGARPRSEFIAGAQPERSAWLVGTDGFGAEARHVAMRTMLTGAMRERLAQAAGASTAGAVLRLRVRAATALAVPVEVALLATDGTAWGTTVTATADWQEVSIAIDGLRRVPYVLLPRPYPTFLPYDLMADTRAPLDLRRVEGIQWGFARPPGDDGSRPVRVEVERLLFVPATSTAQR